MKVTFAKGAIPMDTLARWAGGELILHRIGTVPMAGRACTDSREADSAPDAGTLFCAIRGERVDGHSYMAAVAAHPGLYGCGCFLCEQIPDALTWADTPFAAIRVEDTVAALSRMAAGYRTQELPGLRAVGVTGSVGKTTVKTCCAAVLGGGFSTYHRDGNFNSVIGLPLSVMEISPTHEMAVLEMGMSARGEIQAMSGAVRPHIGIITNVGTSHLEHLGNRENIARAKLEILTGIQPGGYLLVQGDEPLLQDPALLAETGRSDVHILRLSLTDPTADVYARPAEAPENGGMTFDLTLPGAHWPGMTIPAPGTHMVQAAAFGAAVGYLCGLDQGAVQDGLTRYRPATLRQTVRLAGGVYLLEDCYNAAPESMAAALEVLDMTAGVGKPGRSAKTPDARQDAPAPTGRRIAVLGDMKELGRDTVALHRGVGRLCAGRRLDGLVTVGALAVEIAQGACQGGMEPARVLTLGADGEPVDPEAAAARLAGLVRPGDTVLFKASRAMGLERISRALSRLLDR